MNSGRTGNGETKKETGEEIQKRDNQKTYETAYL